MWLDATQAELDALLLDEPEVTEDLVLPDGTVVDKRYVALRNRLNRMSEGLANDPLENSYEIIMRLWTPEEAQQFVDCPNQVWFTAFDYVKKQREKGEDISFVTGGISGSDYGTGSKYPILHVCPVSADVVEGGVISPYRDWRLIIENNTSFGIGECICARPPSPAATPRWTASSATTCGRRVPTARASSTPAWSLASTPTTSSSRAWPSA